MNQQPETCLTHFVAAVLKQPVSWTNQDFALEYLMQLSSNCFAWALLKLHFPRGWHRKCQLPWKVYLYLDYYWNCRCPGWQIPDVWRGNFTQLVDLTFGSFLMLFSVLAFTSPCYLVQYQFQIYIWAKYHILPTKGHFDDSPTKPPVCGIGWSRYQLNH